MTDEERRAPATGNEDWTARNEDSTYEPPRLVVMGSVKELTHGGIGPGPDVSAASGMN